MRYANPTAELDALRRLVDDYVAGRRRDPDVRAEIDWLVVSVFEACCTGAARVRAWTGLGEPEPASVDCDLTLALIERERQARRAIDDLSDHLRDRLAHVPAALAACGDDWRDQVKPCERALVAFPSRLLRRALTAEEPVSIDDVDSLAEQLAAALNWSLLALVGTRPGTARDTAAQWLVERLALVLAAGVEVTLDAAMPAALGIDEPALLALLDPLLTVTRARRGEPIRIVRSLAFVPYDRARLDGARLFVWCTDRRLPAFRARVDGSSIVDVAAIDECELSVD